MCLSGSTALAAQAPCNDVRRAAVFSSYYFERIELEKLVQTVSDITCKTFIIGESVRGKISIVGPDNGKTALTPDQFYAAFLQALDVNGLAVVTGPRFNRIVEKPKSRQSARTPLRFEGEAFPAPDEMVTRGYRLKHLDLEGGKQTLGQFITTGADIISVAPDLLLISDVSANFERIEKLLSAIDIEHPPVEQLKVIAVRNADAADIADKVTRLLQPKGGKPTDAPTVAHDERTNRLLISATPEVLARALELIEQLDVAVPSDGRAHVYRLKHADAKEVAASLEAVVGGGSSSRPRAPTGALPATSQSQTVTGEVRVSVNESLNALVIVAGAADYARLTELIEQLDQPTRQVFIETVIMEVNLTRDTAVGLSAHGATQINGSPIVFGSQPQGAPSSVLPKSMLGMSGLLGGISGPSVEALKAIFGVDVPLFGLAIQASVLSNDVNVLSAPHILTTDNKEAEIAVGRRVPFQLGVNTALTQQLSATNPSLGAYSAALGSVSRERIELKLTVKPHIGDGDSVRLEVNQQAEELAGSNSVGQVTSTRSQKTSVVARDHETVVLGGIMEDRDLDETSKTPLLGDIPILGHLFRATKKTKTKVNLLVFLTPHIVREPADMQRVLDRRMAERKKVLEQFYGASAEADAAIAFDHKPGPLAAIERTVARELQRPENGGRGGPSERWVEPAPAGDDASIR